MTFRRRLIIAFSIVLVLPVILFILSFIVIGNFLARGDNGDGAVSYQDYVSLTDDYKEYSELLDSTYEKIQADLEEDPSLVEDPGYLQSLSERVNVSNSYIVVRKGSDLYYTGNEDCLLTATDSRTERPDIISTVWSRWSSSWILPLKTVRRAAFSSSQGQ